jgi:hypothetical protein
MTNIYQLSMIHKKKLNKYFSPIVIIYYKKSIDLANVKVSKLVKELKKKKTRKEKDG